MKEVNHRNEIHIYNIFFKVGKIVYNMAVLFVLEIYLYSSF